jgi:hypothetical protein
MGEFCMIALVKNTHFSKGKRMFRKSTYICNHHYLASQANRPKQSSKSRRNKNFTGWFFEFWMACLAG